MTLRKMYICVAATVCRFIVLDLDPFRRRLYLNSLTIPLLLPPAAGYCVRLRGHWVVLADFNHDVGYLSQLAAKTGPRVTRARDSAIPTCGIAPPYILTQTMRGWRLGHRPETLRMLYRDLVPWTLNRLAFRHPDSREALGPPERPPVSASVVS